MVSKPFGRSPNKCLNNFNDIEFSFQSPLGVLQIMKIEPVGGNTIAFQSPLGVLQMQGQTSPHFSTPFQSPLGVLQIPLFASKKFYIIEFQSPLGVLQMKIQLLQVPKVWSFKALWAFSKSILPYCTIIEALVSKPFGRSPNLHLYQTSTNFSCFKALWAFSKLPHLKSLKIEAGVSKPFGRSPNIYEEGFYEIKESFKALWAFSK